MTQVAQKSGRGRKIYRKTKYVRQLLTRKPEITWGGGAAEWLAKKGIGPDQESEQNRLSETEFNVQKSQFKKKLEEGTLVPVAAPVRAKKSGRKTAASSVEMPADAMAVAQYVQSQGGHKAFVDAINARRAELAEAQANLEREQEIANQFEQALRMFSSAA